MNVGDNTFENLLLSDGDKTFENLLLSEKCIISSFTNDCLYNKINTKSFVIKLLEQIHKFHGCDLIFYIHINYKPLLVDDHSMMCDNDNCHCGCIILEHIDECGPFDLLGTNGLKRIIRCSKHTDNHNEDCPINYFLRCSYDFDINTFLSTFQCVYFDIEYDIDNNLMATQTIMCSDCGIQYCDEMFVVSFDKSVCRIRCEECHANIE
jgi:hypothetical protein